ncbi:MAG: DNA-3-methyladenine glycosylase 2 family protein, partial [Caulobacteraceae bacterium]|nr:DNA-3-methyladenine glycosylase 2 family protein [Caulobacter sp.]
DELKLCGLSAAKLKTLRALAAARTSGALDFEALAKADAEVAHAALCALRGIGPWTADVFLLFCLGHADAFPAGDLALQEGAKLALDLETRPDAKALIAIAERWRPLRGVAAHCLWAYYSFRRKAPSTLDGAAPQP